MNPPFPNPIRLFIVDDHKVVRAGLKQLLEDAPDILIVGDCATGGEALTAAPCANTDVLLLDLRLPDAQGFEICQKLKHLHPNIRVLILTSYLDDDSVLKALAAGIDGYLLKEIDGPDLALAIRTVAAGEASLDPRVARKMMERTKPSLDPLAKLSFQEKKILALVAEGKMNKEIGLELGLGEKTIRNYLSALMQKLNVSRRAEAAAIFSRYAQS